MKTLVCIFITAFIIIGCASYSQIMINPEGQKMICSAHGYSLIGVAQANQIQNDCIASLKAAGYIEIEKAGVVGIYFSEPLATDTSISILKVAPKSPAALAGIRGGDILLSVDNQKVRKVMDAGLLIFGMAGTSVQLVL